jgi:hypothetical protein
VVVVRHSRTSAFDKKTGTAASIISILFLYRPLAGSL